VRVTVKDILVMGVSSVVIVTKGWCDQQKKLTRKLLLVKETKDWVGTWLWTQLGHLEAEGGGVE
jgi:hypothetical protein